jgi:outer membrane protein assembly factor BamB
MSSLQAFIRNSAIGLLPALGLLWLWGCGGGGSNAAPPVTATPPTLTAISPGEIEINSPAFVVTATGNNITAQTVVQWAGAALATSYVSAEQTTALVPAANLTTAGSYPITLVTDGASSAAVQFTVQPAPVPTITGLAPIAATAGGAGFVLWVYGTNFTSQSVVNWGGSARSTSFGSTTLLTAQINAADIATAGAIAVTVQNQTVLSAPAQFTVLTVPAPTITQLSPNSAIVGGAGFTLTVSGSNFNSQSVVNWAGSPRTTIYVSASQLTAQINAADIAATGTVAVTVQNQTVASAPSNFTVVPVPPVMISSVTPSTVSSGGPAFMLTVNGSAFNTASAVIWNGSARVTTYQSTSLLTAQILASDIAAAGSATVTVQNPANQGGTSGPATVTIRPASLDAVAFQINPAHSGAISFQSASLPTGALWSVNVGGPASFALIAQNLVYVTVASTSSTTGGVLGELIALNQSSGATVWGPVEISGSSSSAYDNGMVFVVNAGGLMQAFNATNGNLLWSATLPDQLDFSSGVTALNGYVYTGGAESGGTVYALSETTGALIWTAEVENGDDSTPAVTADGVYVVYPCQAYDFNPASGASIWRNAGGCEGGGGGTPVVANGLLYQPGPSYSGDTLNAETGAVVSSYVADNPPALGATTGYFLQSGTLRGLNLSSNTVLWSFAGDGHLVSNPLLVNNYVFIGSSSGNLYAVDGTSGAQLWQMSLGAAIPGGATFDSGIPLNGLSAGDGLLVVPAGDTVTAYLLSSDP